MVREAVVSSFDSTEGRYVLERIDGETERMSLEELQNALAQSQVHLVGLSYSGLP